MISKIIYLILIFLNPITHFFYPFYIFFNLFCFFVLRIRTKGANNKQIRCQRLKREVIFFGIKYQALLLNLFIILGFLITSIKKSKEFLYPSLLFVLFATH